MDANRNLLGVTVSGGNACIDGAEGCGVAFKLVPNGAQSTYTVLLYTFCALNDCRDGANPSSPLFQNSGNLLGTTLAGGKPDALGDPYGAGTIFMLAEGEKVLHSFCQKQDCIDGLQPSGGLVMDVSGNLFGVAENGGRHEAGVIFELSP